MSIILLSITPSFLPRIAKTLLVDKKKLSIFERGEVVGAWKCESTDRKVNLREPREDFVSSITKNMTWMTGKTI
ncbi:hypothetical protein RIR_jg15194.t1 [Rhizophagus irregularis DAOM 181602=DAOM 197198]|nr:hypothetical protein RIR_jg15194.t1 [Rhizophagus irregularis DAOM 181602=DAOM 197198]